MMVFLLTAVAWVAFGLITAAVWTYYAPADGPPLVVGALFGPVLVLMGVCIALGGLFNGMQGRIEAAGRRRQDRIRRAEADAMLARLEVEREFRALEAQLAAPHRACDRDAGGMAA